MPDLINIFMESLQQLVVQLAVWLPKLIIALIIWWIGKYLLNLGSHWIRKIDIPKTKIDNRFLKKVDRIFITLGKIILILIILDYLGIGTSIVSALANGLTLSVAIAVGISFGKAMEKDAQSIIDEAKSYFVK